MLKKAILAAGLLCLCLGSAMPRQVDLDVNSLLTRVSTHNAEVKSARSNLDTARQGVSVAKSARLPRISASLDLNFIGDGTVLDRDFTNAMRDRLPHFGNTLNVSLYQPVYQGGAINAGIDLASQQADLASIGVDQQLETSANQAVNAYYLLVKMRNLRKVYEENIDLTKRLIEHMTAHYEQGTALRNDITRYELRLSSLQYDLRAIDNSISVANRNLVSLLGFDEGDDIVPLADSDSRPDLKSEEYWQQLASDNSNELQAIDKVKSITETGIRLDKASMRPSVGIIIGDQLTGPITFEIPAINKNYNAWFAGVSIGYDFSSLYTANKKIRQKRLELMHTADQREAASEALSRRVHEAYVLAIQAGQQLETETVNIRLANENYEVVQTRFQNDMALLTDMLDASTAKLDAETRLVNARINLLLGFYQLKYISGTLTD